MGVDGVYVVAVAMVRLMALWYPIMSILLVVVMTMVMVVSFSPETVVSLQPMQATVKERHDIDAEEHGTDSSVDHGDCDGDDDHDDDDNIVDGNDEDDDDDQHHQDRFMILKTMVVMADP